MSEYEYSNRNSQTVARAAAQATYNVAQSVFDSFRDAQARQNQVLNEELRILRVRTNNELSDLRRESTNKLNQAELTFKREIAQQKQDYLGKISELSSEVSKELKLINAEIKGFQSNLSRISKDMASLDSRVIDMETSRMSAQQKASFLLSELQKEINLIVKLHPERYDKVKLANNLMSSIETIKANINEGHFETALSIVTDKVEKAIELRNEMVLLDSYYEQIKLLVKCQLEEFDTIVKYLEDVKVKFEINGVAFEEGLNLTEMSPRNSMGESQFKQINEDIVQIRSIVDLENGMTLEMLKEGNQYLSAVLPQFGSVENGEYIEGSLIEKTKKNLVSQMDMYEKFQKICQVLGKDRGFPVKDYGHIDGDYQHPLVVKMTKDDTEVMMLLSQNGEVIFRVIDEDYNRDKTERIIKEAISSMLDKGDWKYDDSRCDELNTSESVNQIFRERASFQLMKSILEEKKST